MELKHRIQNQPEKEGHLLTLDSLYQHFLYNNYDSAYYYARKMTDLAYRYNRISSISVGHTGIGHIYKNQGKYDSAVYHHRLAAHWNKLDTFAQGEAIAYANIANIFQLQGQYDSAVVYMRQAESVFKSTDLKPSYLGSLNQIKQNLATIYLNIGWYEEALIEIEECQKWFKENKQPSGIAYTNLLKGEAVFRMGNLPIGKKLMEEAIFYYQNTNARTFHVRALVYYTDLLIALQDYDQAQENLHVVQKHMAHISSASDSARVLLLSGKIRLKNQQYEHARAELEKAYDIAEKINLYPLRAESLLYISRAYEAMGNSKNALKNLYAYVELSQKILDGDKARTIRDLEGKYLLKERDQQLILAQTKNQAEKNKNQFILTVSVILMLLICTTYIRYKQKQKLSKRLMESLSERELLLTEIHHRVKNNLQIVNSLLNLQKVQEGELTPKEMIIQSQSRIHAMSMIHENLYRSKNLEKIELPEYLKSICVYFSQAYNLDQQNINIDLYVQAPDQTLDRMVPLGLIINELIINSFKHAFDKDGGRILIDIQYFPEEQNSVLTYQDSGKKDLSQYTGKKTTSIGMQLIAGLVKQMKGNWESVPGEGAHFILTWKN